jgi:UDP-glucose 4-epimerase
MKKILITGANSYIGTSFEKYINDNYANQYQVDTIDMIDGSWRNRSFKEYDTVFHVAGIAHQKETKENAHLYYEINRDLAIEVAKKAKVEGVKQFIFLSSMSVYGMDTGVITKETKPNPKTNYGKSKFEAEQQIVGLRDEMFRVCVLRPPMVYGDGCKGNYQTIVKFVKKFPFFPRVNNKRSLVHIDNLVTFIKEAMDQELDGLYFPQDKEYVKTIDLAKDIAKKMNKRIYFSFLFGFGVIILRPFVGKFKKAFGNLIYKGTNN